MNTKLLKRVAAAILKRPTQFQMAWWFDTELDYACTEKAAGGCGTAACIAGWTLHLGTKNKRLAATRKRFDEEVIQSIAATRLGLDDDLAARRLFGLSYWPSKFADKFRSSKTPLTRARVAADRIDHFITTKGAE